MKKGTTVIKLNHIFTRFFKIKPVMGLKTKKTRRSFLLRELNSALYFVGSQTTGTYPDPFGSAVNDGSNTTDIGFPTAMGFNIRVAYQITGLKIFATD